MSRRFPLALAIALSAAVLFAAPLLDAQKGKTPPEVNGSFSVRTGLDPTGDNPLGDRVTGDGLGDYSADGAGTYVKLNSNREFRAGLYGSRFLQLDFLDGVLGTLCGSGCFRTFGRFVIPQPNTYPPEGPFRVVMQTNVVTSGNVEVTNGLFSLAVGGAAGHARFFISFMDPGGRDFHWSVLFNPAEYAGSNLVSVRRTAACAWTIEALAGTQGGLRAWAVLKGKNNSSNEGRFAMPFALAFTAPNCGGS